MYEGETILEARVGDVSLFFVAHADGKMRLNEQFTTLQSSLGAQSKQLNVVNDATGKNNRAAPTVYFGVIFSGTLFYKMFYTKKQLNGFKRQKRMNVEARADNKFPAALFSSVSHILAIIYDRFMQFGLGSER
ncbi:hypothetical protein Tco_0778976 [Tanacetum coccineum]